MRYSGLVDVHCHALPGIDDGPKDLADALALVRAAAVSGVSTLTATPHVRSDFPDVHLDELAGRVATLQAEADREGIALRLVTGGEVALDWAIVATGAELRLASYGQRGKDLLIETPEAPVAGLGQLLYQPRSKGFRVTLAHPERGPDFQRDPSLLEDLVAQGILLQLDAAALLGSKRSAARRLAHRLCRDGLAHVIASDGHRAASWRPVTALADAVEVAAGLVGPDRAEWMVRDAPAAIVAGVPLPEAPSIEGGTRVARRLVRRRA